MKITTFVWAVATMLALSPSIGSAQDRKVHVNIGGGPTINAGDIGDHFGTGWGPAIGVTVDANERIGFLFEYAYRYFHIQDDAPILNATRFSANHQTHQLAFNLVYNFVPANNGIRPYFTAGPGAYNRNVKITEYVGTGVICDPYYYVCGTYPVEDVLGSRGGWDFGFNIGGGVGFGIGDNTEFYIESRYHTVIGPEIVSATPFDTQNGGSTNGSYYPITFGLRF